MRRRRRSRSRGKATHSERRGEAADEEVREDWERGGSAKLQRWTKRRRRTDDGVTSALVAGDDPSRSRRSFGALKLVSERLLESADNHEAGGHGGGSADEERAATDLVEPDDGGEGADDGCRGQTCQSMWRELQGPAGEAAEDSPRAYWTDEAMSSARRPCKPAPWKT